ncbi:MAG: 50S ribosomal protein L4 [Verrucomicrobiales bacterium]|nr:50S ribosomal protein L4 [Verrucomicrobiales bacterium]
MAAKAFTEAAAKKAKIGIIEDENRGRQAVHDVVVAIRANRRSGTAHTKTRGEVACSGKKPFRQKGTGRARQGGNAPPIHRGGGVAFGPRNERNYKKATPKSIKRLAFTKALTERIKSGDVVTTGKFAVEDGKTKSFVKEVDGLVDDAKRVLIVGADFDEMTKRAGRNYQPVLLMSAGEVNTEHLLLHDKIVLVDDALETLASRTVEN